MTWTGRLVDFPPRERKLRLTIDSNDNLDRVLEVVGSLFGVPVQVAPDTPSDATTPAVATPVGAAKPARPGPAGRGTKARRGRRTASNSETASGKASTAQVRQWARHTGLQISDRGRIPATVLEAYQAAH